MYPGPATLAATVLVDADHPDMVALAREHSTGAGDRERAVSLYNAVRDDFRYYPYPIDITPEGMRARTAMAAGNGWCVSKAALLAAACRAAGIPAWLSYADVRNHLSTERMRQSMKTDLFIWHGYTDIWIDGEWRKATHAAAAEIPEGFHPMPPPTGHIDVNGPLYVPHVPGEAGDEVQVGLRVEPRQSNPMHNCHGGMLATFADMLFPLSILRLDATVKNRFLITVNLKLGFHHQAHLLSQCRGRI